MSRIFGAITQNGYVMRDIQAAMRHWIEVLGVGPWHSAESHLKIPLSEEIMAMRGER